MVRMRPHCVGALAACLLGVTGCAVLEPPAPLAPPPDLTLRNVHVSQFQRGALTARIATAELQYTRDTGHLEGRDGTLRPLTGTLAGGTLLAGLTVGSTRSGSANLSHMVHWTGPGGDQVDTAACTVDFVKQVVRGTEPVTMEGAGYTLGAQGFESRFGVNSEIHLSGGVRVHLSEDNSADGPEP